MTCRSFKSADGKISGWVCFCGREPEVPVCSVKDCEQPAPYLCDARIKARKKRDGKTQTTCDRRICETHRTAKGSGDDHLDLCPHHSGHRKPLLIHTARISYGGPFRLDITRKGGSSFGPSWPLLQAAKAGKIDFQGYRLRYFSEMRASYKIHNAEWLQLLTWERVVLCCYCVNHLQCHRILLAEMLVLTAKARGIAASYEGELT